MYREPAGAKIMKGHNMQRHDNLGFTLIFGQITKMYFVLAKQTHDNPTGCLPSRGSHHGLNLNSPQLQI